MRPPPRRTARRAPGSSAPVAISTSVRLAFGRRLRAWYRRHARELPWRRTRDAYEILVSELMLQQTQVARVVPKYGEFLDRFPTLDAVAAAPVRQVTEAWHGLGYYARARHLHQLARALTGPRRLTDGPTRATLPADVAALRALPGIGAYTAGAVVSFAYERRAALVDTNVARVLTRVFAPHLDPRSPRGRRAAWAIAESTLPRSGTAAYTHNQALIELGALICTARVAHCDRCPVRGMCRSAVSRQQSGTTRLHSAPPAGPSAGLECCC
jgi:A/G-specific adenine glycosylase